MATALDEILRRSLPPGAVVHGSIRVSLRCAGRELPVTVTGLAKQLLQLGHAASLGDRLAAGTRAVLTMDLEDASLRVDLPVKIVTWGHAHVVLRAIAAPLVLRRRISRDHALAEALGARRATSPAVAA